MKKRNQAPKKQGKTTQKTAQQQARSGRSKIDVPNIPKDWKEVAHIDFCGFLDRDCEERIIYKTPEGDLKAARSSSNHGLEAIEDVQRDQVTLWIQECVVPEEFSADFSLPRRPTKSDQHESRRFSRDIMISKRRADILGSLARELKIDPKEIGENAIASYLAFIEKFPHLAEAQPRVVRMEAVFAPLAAGPLYDQLDRACAIYDLDRNSVADSAIGAYIDLVLRHERAQGSREFMLNCRGASDPENICFILSRPSEHARSMFDKSVQQISSQPFAQACTEFGELRELMMHHPALKTEREALEMIVEGASRLT
jgi:hypothetical protein